MRSTCVLRGLFCLSRSIISYPRMCKHVSVCVFNIFSIHTKLGAARAQGEERPHPQDHSLAARGGLQEGRREETGAGVCVYMYTRAEAFNFHLKFIVVVCFHVTPLHHPPPVQVIHHCNSVREQVAFLVPTTEGQMEKAIGMLLSFDRMGHGKEGDLKFVFQSENVLNT